MCKKKKKKHLFTSYQSYDGGKIMMGNNTFYRELSNVRHVLELKRNLISLSMLDKAGCCIRVESSLLKVIKGYIVLMKCDMSNGLYILQGIVISGDASVAENQIQDKTLPWHLRLRHISEKGLKKLEKQEALVRDKINAFGFCEEFTLSKSSRTKFKTIVHIIKGFFAYIHVDLWGSLQI